MNRFFGLRTHPCHISSIRRPNRNKAVVTERGLSLDSISFVVERQLFRFLRGSSEEDEGDLMMESAIEISSGSSSDEEEEEVSKPIKEEVRTRKNPPWLDGSSSFPQKAGNTQAKARPTNPVSRYGAPSYASRPRDSSRTSTTGNVNSRTSSVPSGVDYEKKLPLKRTLPPSFNSTPVPPRSSISNSVIQGNVSRFGADYSSSLAVSNKTAFGDRHRGAHSEIGIHRGMNGVRILPPSMTTHGTSASSPLHYGGPSDPIHRVGVGEDRNSENDERLIYQAALQDLNQPRTEIDLPPGILSVPLMRHQKIALAWMFQKETSSLHCSGGILADDQGLGKTVSMIALILKQKFESQLKSEISSKEEAEILDLDADDDLENAKYESKSHAKPELISSNSETTVLSIKAEAEILDLDADDESENAKHENESHTKTELKVLTNSETTVLSVGDSDENDSSDTEKVKDEEASTSVREFKRKRPAAGTLVVCPASLVRQWARELDEKVSDESKLSVLVYHGGNRTKDPIELANYDVVVTTYAIVTNEVPKQSLLDEDENDEDNNEKHGLNKKKRKVAMKASKKSKKRGRKSVDGSSFDSDCGTLSKVGWLRVVLDEAQTIKNHTTQVARACCTLRAKRRWCLSGTPIQNTIDDLYSYFRFLRYNPYAVYKSFYHTIKVPISKSSLHGYKKLQVVLKAIMLRRTKGTLLDGKPIINLPPKKISLSKVDFSVEERSFYKKLEADSRSQFKAYAAAGTLGQNYGNILLMLLRLRQACDHPQLVHGYNSDPLGKESEEAVERLPREARINLLNRLESSSAICNICDDPPENPVVSLCGHVFCYQCVSEHITGDENVCPVRRCREDIGRDVVFSESSLRKCITNDIGCSSSQDKSVFRKSEFSSSKIKAVLDILKSLSEHGQMPSSSSQPHDDDDDVTIIEPTSLQSSSPSQGPIKTIVFSQWTGMLDLVEQSFFENGIEFRRLDGTMSLAARDRAVKEFCNDPDVEVMLMSLKAGNLGLNMVAACHVILLDLWWNPTTEDQAIDRAHRIGQTRPVSVTRITIKGTVEDRILSLQEEKRKIVASAYGEDHGGSSATRLTVDDLKYLFMV
ncbi:SNF2 domain-containing protein / helicase domain-containing protein / zinc finger protein-related [Raphanus sativus]|nr:SNF2 domain-containing protein / helicase domain-containing protein / zinc finger protein-related [Raphanus sativus]